MAAQDRSALSDLIDGNLGDNTTGEITPQDVRDVFDAMVESSVNLVDDASLSRLPEVVKTADHTIAAADAGTMLIANKATAITFALPAVAGSASEAYLVRNIGAGLLTVDPNSTEQIEGATTLTLATGESALIWANAGKTAWRGSVWRPADGVTRDDRLIAADPADNTKRVRLDAGNVTAGQTRVLTMADADIDLAALSNGLRYIGTVQFTSSGTFSKGSYPGLAAVKLRQQAPGGGGGGCGVSGTGNSMSAGGGGGEYKECLILASSLSTNQAVTVGAAGTVAASTANGGNGGNSSFASVVCQGGRGGDGMAATTGNGTSVGGAGGTGGSWGSNAVSGTDLSIPGQPGGPGRIQGGAVYAWESWGGSAFLGAGGIAATAASAGSAGIQGGGGSGTFNNTASAVSGYAGGGGITLLDLYVGAM